MRISGGPCQHPDTRQLGEVRDALENVVQQAELEVVPFVAEELILD
jgi:hypothetical protein